jgi:hypothetical protein
VQALSDFEIYGPYIRDQKSKKLFSNLITAMRSAFKEKPISFKLIDNVLLGGPNTFSDVEKLTGSAMTKDTITLLDLYVLFPYTTN